MYVCTVCFVWIPFCNRIIENKRNNTKKKYFMEDGFKKERLLWHWAWCDVNLKRPILTAVGPANDKHQAPTNGLKLYARAVTKSEA